MGSCDLAMSGVRFLLTDLFDAGSYYNGQAVICDPDNGMVNVQGQAKQKVTSIPVASSPRLARLLHKMSTEQLGPLPPRPV